MTAHMLPHEAICHVISELITEIESNNDRRDAYEQKGIFLGALRIVVLIEVPDSHQELSRLIERLADRIEIEIEDEDMVEKALDHLKTELARVLDGAQLSLEVPLP